MEKERKSQVFKSVVFAVIWIAVVMGLGALFTSFHRDWYAALAKPAFNPPPAVFTIVWSALYLMLGASFSLALITGADQRTKTLFFVTGILNILFSLFFFTFKLPFAGLIIIIASLAVGGYLAARLYRINRISFWLFVPYLVWLLFAMILNYSIIMLN